MNKYEVTLTTQGTCWKEAYVEVEAENEEEAIAIAQGMDVDYEEVYYDAMDYGNDGASLISKG